MEITVAKQMKKSQMVELRVKLILEPVMELILMFQVRVATTINLNLALTQTDA